MDVNTDMQIASPQVMVDIDRDRALALGVTPQQIQDALFTAYGAAAGVDDLRAGQPILGDHGGGAAISAQSGCAVEAVRSLVARFAGAARRRGRRVTRTVGPLNVNHFGQLPAVTISFNLRPGFSLGEAAAAGGRCHPGTAHAGRRSARTFQGTVKEFQRSFQNLSILLIVAILVIYIVLGILYESFIHPITILSGLPSAVFGALLTLLMFQQGDRPVCLCRHHHAVRRSEEERDHDDRLRASTPAAKAQSRADAI